MGEQDLEGAARTATHVVFLGIAVSVVMGLPGIIFAPQLFRLLGAEPHVIELGTPFMQIMLGTNIVIVFLFLLNGIFRGAGDAAIALRVLIIANGLNILFCPLFIFGIGPFPELGVTGAAVATVCGRGAGVAYAAWALFVRENGRLNVKREHWKFDPKLLWSLVTLSSTAVLQFLIATLSWSGLVMILAGFGTFALAGYQIGLRVIMFVLLPAVGLANAAATLVGQNLGAGQPERAERSVWTAGILNAVLLGDRGRLLRVFLGLRYWRLYPGERGCRVWPRLPADRRLRLRILRPRHGDGKLVQRCRGHVDTDLLELHRFLADRDTAGVRPVDQTRLGPARRLLGDHYLVLHPRHIIGAAV